jgi:hypothetical protein
VEKPFHQDKHRVASHAAAKMSFSLAASTPSADTLNLVANSMAYAGLSRSLGACSRMRVYASQVQPSTEQPEPRSDEFDVPADVAT